MGAVPEVKVLP